MRKKLFRLAFCLFFFFWLFLPGLSPASDNPRDYTLHLIGHAHIDLAWLWLWEETVQDVCVHTFSQTLSNMKSAPGLTFAQSQAAVYEEMEKRYPELFRQIKERISEGTWIPVGGMWCEPDLNLPSGESLVRQLLYGKGYFKEKFGVDVEVGWNPDSFGHNWALPQLLSQAGIKYYIFERCAPKDTTLFWWEGIDGSRVLAYVPPGWYLARIDENLKKAALEAGRKSGLKDILILHGEGDHGGGPRPSDLEAMARLESDPEYPHLRFTTAQAYFEKIASSLSRIPVHKNELNFTFPGCYTTQVETKKNNRQAENLLLAAEKFSALAVTSGYRSYYPERDIDEAWKIVLRNQFHDILCGSSIGPVYEEAQRYYEEAFRRARRALDFSLETIADAVDTRGEGKPLLVFNPLAWVRTGPALFRTSFSEKPVSFRITGPEGEDIPYQILEAGDRQGRYSCEGIFLAENVPSLGYKLYRIGGIDEASASTTPSSLKAEPHLLENEFFRVIIDPDTGWMESLFDKRYNREYLSGKGNVLQAIADEPEHMSAWEISLKDRIWNIGEEDANVEVLEKGPVRATVRVKSRFRQSAFIQDISLWQGFPQVDIRLETDWQERNIMVKAAFPVAVKNGRAWFEIPFAAINRPADGTEVPALKWVDISGDYGLSLLNDSRYGFDVKGNVMRISLIRGATSPDPEADKGRHVTRYALYPHEGDWKKGDTILQAYEFNNPLLAREALVHPGSLPAEFSFIQVEPENVVLTSVKKPRGYTKTGLVLRVFESFGKETEARIRLPWPVEVRKSEILEGENGEVISQGKASFSFKLKPHEILTLLIHRER